MEQSLQKKIRVAWETVRVSRKFLVSGGIILALILVAIFAPLIAPYHYDVQDYSNIRAKPSAQYWLGTDLLGRDLLSRMIYGTRISVSVGVIVIVLEALVGVSAAALTVYDMCKALDKGMEITDIVLVEKIGGKSGHYLRNKK